VKWTAASVNIGPTVFAGDARGHKLFGDVPPALGGHDAAMIPPEGVLVVLANCMGMEIALACKNKGIPYEGMRLEVEADWDEEVHFLENFRLKILMPETLDERGRRTVEAAAKMCTTRNTLMRGTTVEVETVY
jgi:uncharacterized OsmC-like protein